MEEANANQTLTILSTCGDIHINIMKLVLSILVAGSTAATVVWHKEATFSAVLPRSVCYYRAVHKAMTSTALARSSGLSEAYREATAAIETTHLVKRAVATVIMCAIKTEHLATQDNAAYVCLSHGCRLMTMALMTVYAMTKTKSARPDDEVAPIDESVLIHVLEDVNWALGGCRGGNASLVNGDGCLDICCRLSLHLHSQFLLDELLLQRHPFGSAMHRCYAINDWQGFVEAKLAVAVFSLCCITCLDVFQRGGVGPATSNLVVVLLGIDDGSVDSIHYAPAWRASKFAACVVSPFESAVDHLLGMRPGFAADESLDTCDGWIDDTSLGFQNDMDRDEPVDISPSIHAWRTLMFAAGIIALLLHAWRTVVSAACVALLGDGTTVGTSLGACLGEADHASAGIRNGPAIGVSLDTCLGVADHVSSSIRYGLARGARLASMIGRWLISRMTLPFE